MNPETFVLAALLAGQRTLNPNAEFDVPLALRMAQRTFELCAQFQVEFPAVGATPEVASTSAPVSPAAVPVLETVAAEETQTQAHVAELPAAQGSDEVVAATPSECPSTQDFADPRDFVPETPPSPMVLEPDTTAHPVTLNAAPATILEAEMSEWLAQLRREDEARGAVVAPAPPPRSPITDLDMARLIATLSQSSREHEPVPAAPELVVGGSPSGIAGWAGHPPVSPSKPSHKRAHEDDEDDQAVAVYHSTKIARMLDGGRMARAGYENMRIESSVREPDGTLSCVVHVATGAHYDVQVLYPFAMSSCTCPDFCARAREKGPCKHLLYLMLKHLGIERSKIFDTDVRSAELIR